MRQKELAWVDYLRKKAPKSRDVLVGIGDDCAVVKSSRSKILLKSDLFIEGVHFDRKHSSLRHIGMRAVARVLSDFAACAARPRFIGISAGFPPGIRTKDLKNIFEGVLRYARKYRFSLIGGDTSRSAILFLDVWGLGQAQRCILRSTAQSGDHLFLSGPLGRRRFNLPFEPRIKEAGFLARDFKVNAMIDISDAFALDLHRLLSASKKGALLYYDHIPLSNGDADLYRGEDYELIFSVDKTDERLEALKKRFYYIGIVKPRGFGCKIQRNKTFKDLPAKGYLHI
jgi:thiamine-monophosphate kinase